ncbi:hypothetical protein MN116_005766 [Schistosoma mekongi]|uniref:Protein quiver n=1 Tax=Schistosoma mekongi TaxID=38744 RepID=A0AAE1ZAK4_SCHME|nr:hypothetical protein MN116_005766 [Schistosoma mekongi]
MKIVSLQLVGVYYMHLTLKLALAADPDHCPGQRIKCYSCNSIEDTHCNDPFFRQPQQTKSFPLVDCNDYCFKWAFQGPDGQKHLIRNCSTNLNMKMEKYLVCIAESRSSIGYLCFCNKDKCNLASQITKQLHYNFYIIFIILIYLFNYYYYY